MPKLMGFPDVSLPGPPPMPLLGHLPRVIRFLVDPVAAIPGLRAMGDVVAVSRDSPALVCVFGPERNREVLTRPDDFRHDEEMFRGPEGSSIATLSGMINCINGDRHRQHRRLIAPAFSKANLAVYAEQIVDFAETAVASWPRGEAFDLDAAFSDLSLSIAVRTLFGVDVRDGNSDLGDLAREFSVAVTRPTAMLLQRDLPLSPYRHASRLGDRLLERLAGIVAAKRAADDPGNDVLSRMLTAVDDDGHTFTDAELMPELIALFFAGFETTVKTLDWTIYLLDRHPDVHAAILAELEEVLGGRPVTADDLPRLEHLDRAIKESMRLLPTMPVLFMRVASGEVELGPYTLPPGSNVVVSPFQTHREPDLYPEPRRFLPDRWIATKRSVFEYMPFGAGPRICLGAGFARQSTRLILATLLQRARVSIPESARVDYQVQAVSLVPKGGLPAKLEAPGEAPVAATIRGNMGELVDLPVTAPAMA